MAPEPRPPFSNYGWRARLGVIVPPTNTVNEAEWGLMAPEGVTVHSARMPLHADTGGAEAERTLFDDLERASGDLAQAGVDVIAYGCTAGSMVAPMTRLTDFMTGATGIPAVATAPAIVHALGALGVRRVALATPYGEALNADERRFLAANGVEVVAAQGLGYGDGGPDEYVNIARVPVAEVFEFVRAADTEAAEAVVVSCTDFATSPIIARLEAALAKPMVTSNQATLWAALRAAGLDLAVPGFGRLLDHGGTRT